LQNGVQVERPVYHRSEPVEPLLKWHASPHVHRGLKGIVQLGHRLTRLGGLTEALATPNDQRRGGPGK
jgi:hypothetical protein